MIVYFWYVPKGYRKQHFHSLIAILKIGILIELFHNPWNPYSSKGSRGHDLQEKSLRAEKKSSLRHPGGSKMLPSDAQYLQECPNAASPATFRTYDADLVQNTTICMDFEGNLHSRDRPTILQPASNSSFKKNRENFLEKYLDFQKKVSLPKHTFGARWELDP